MDFSKIYESARPAVLEFTADTAEFLGERGLRLLMKSHPGVTIYETDGNYAEVTFLIDRDDKDALFAAVQDYFEDTYDRDDFEELVEHR